jgi:diacylglycerol kinase family enzyme
MNPGSRGGLSRKSFKTIFSLLDEAKIPYHYQITSSLQDAYEFSVSANQNSTKTIIAVGGDGTINQVINGFYDEQGQKYSDSRLGIIYTGTSPDFCKSYNIPANIYKAIAVIKKDKLRKIQLGKIQISAKNLKSVNGKDLTFSQNTITRVFGCCANIGLGAMLARQANSGIRKYLGDFTGSFLSLLNTLVKYNPGDFTIIKDGEKFTAKNIYNLSIGRTKYIASGIKVSNKLEDGDGKLYCLQVSNLGVFNTPALIKKIYSGKSFSNNNYLSLSYCQSIEIYGNYNNPDVEFDGDPRGFLPCRIEVAPDSLEVFVD